MKKILLAVAVVAFFASCKKDYTCTETNLDGTTDVTTYTSVSKSNANYLKADCEKTRTNGSYTYSKGVWDSK
jgi:hypothetical protein